MKNMKKMRNFTVALMVAAFLLPASAWAEDLTIAYADLQRALNVSLAGQKAKETMEAEIKRREAALNDSQEELKNLKNEIDTKSAVWSDEARKKKEMEFQIMAQDFQRRLMATREEFALLRQEVEGKIINELRDIVIKLAKEKGYTYVLEVSLGGIIYGPENGDITKELLEIYDREFQESGG